MKEFFEAVEEAKEEYNTDYRPELERLTKARADKVDSEKQEQLAKLMADMEAPSGSAGGSGGGGLARGFSATRGAGEDPGRHNPFGPHGRNEREDQ